jgi:hypothetical protein
MRCLLPSLLLLTLSLAGCSSEAATSNATGTSTGTSHGGAGGGGAGGGHGGEGDPVIFTESVTQETVPAFLHPTQHKIYRWNYRLADLDAMFEVDLRPTGGAGTKADPWRLAQKRTLMAGAPPQNSAYVYRRLYFDPLTGIALVSPRAESNWFAIRM